MLAFIAYFAVKLFTAETAKNAKQKGRGVEFIKPLALIAPFAVIILQHAKAEVLSRNEQS